MHGSFGTLQLRNNNWHHLQQQQKDKHSGGAPFSANCELRGNFAEIKLISTIWSN